METLAIFSTIYRTHNSHRFHPRLRHHALQSADRFGSGMVVLAAKIFSYRDNSSDADSIVFHLQFVARCALVESNYVVLIVDLRVWCDVDGTAKSF